MGSVSGGKGNVLPTGSKTQHNAGHTGLTASATRQKGAASPFIPAGCACWSLNLHAQGLPAAAQVSAYHVGGAQRM